MKTFVAVLALVAVAAADVSHLVRNQDADQNAAIVKQDADVGPESFNYEYQTSNGIAAQASGQLKNAGQDNVALVSQGSVSYTAPDGQPISLTYIADENGYQPQGAHLPVPPPIPEAILRSLQYQQANPQKPEPIVYQAKAQAQAGFGKPIPARFAAFSG